MLAQSYPNWEQIIIDNGSTDRTPEIISRYQDSRIRYYHQENHGIFKLAETYNQALSLARGELIAILEGDDFWPPDKLETQVKCFEDTNLILSFGQCAYVSPKGKILTVQSYQHLPASCLNELPVDFSNRLYARRQIVDPSCYCVYSAVCSGEHWWVS